MKIKLLYIVSHPIQYQAPLLRYIGKDPEIDLFVIFEKTFKDQKFFDKGFSVPIQWDVDLTTGYNFCSLDEMDKVNEKVLNADIVWIHGWDSRFKRKTLRFAKRHKIPVLMRGENTQKSMPDGWGIKGLLKRLYLKKIFDNLIDVKDDGSFRLDQSFFDYCTGLQMTSEKFHTLFKGKPIKAESNLTQREMDLAASIQRVTEEIVLKLTRSIQNETGHKNLCLAGGVALNCVANGKILRDSKFKNIWIQPAAGDSGGSLGAALCGYHHFLGKPRLVNKRDNMEGSYLGPEFSDEEIKLKLEAIGAVFENYSENIILDKTAHALADGQAVGWFQGRMEFGPRALGGRSILGDARSPKMQKTLNLKIKFRESFRPFAPSVLLEDAADWFNLEGESPYMLIVSDVLKKRRLTIGDAEKDLFGIEKLNVQRSKIPAVTHVDYSARIQTVSKNNNLKYYKLISKFKELTNCPVIANTSFNIRGEPIVCSPEDAFQCFMGCEMDVLTIGNQILYKADQDPALALDYRDMFKLD